MKKFILIFTLFLTTFSIWSYFTNNQIRVSAELIPDFDGASDAFSNALREGKSNVSIEDFSIPPKSMDMLFQYAQAENPDVFWFPTSISYSFPEDKEIVSEITWENSYEDFSEIKKMHTEFEKYANEAINVCFEQGMSDFDKILSAHDYITERTNYVQEDIYSFTAYSVFVRKEGVCQGYAYAFKYLMKMAGIECYYASSPSLEHGWNVVSIDGNYYYVDVTHDDPVTRYNNTIIEYGCETHEKLLCSEEEFDCDADDIIIWCPNGTPECIDTKYDNAFFRNIKGSAEYINGEWYFIESRENISSARRIMKYDKNGVSVFMEFKNPVYSIDNHMETLYISSKDTIYSVDNGELVEFCSTVGEIFGCFSMEGSLHYGIYKKKNFSLCTKTLPINTNICKGTSVEVNSTEAILHFYTKPYIELWNGTITYTHGNEEKTLLIKNISPNGVISIPFPVCCISEKVTLTINCENSSTSYSISVMEYAEKIISGEYDQGIRNIAKALSECVSYNGEYDFSNISQNNYILNDKSSTVEYIETSAEIENGITLTHSFKAPSDTEFFSDGNAFLEENEGYITVCLSDISPFMFEKRFTVTTKDFSIKFSVLDYINICKNSDMKTTLYSHYLYGKALLEYSENNSENQ